MCMPGSNIVPPHFSGHSRLVNKNLLLSQVFFPSATTEKIKWKGGMYIFRGWVCWSWRYKHKAIEVLTALMGRLYSSHGLYPLGASKMSLSVSLGRLYRWGSAYPSSPGYNRCDFMMAFAFEDFIGMLKEDKYHGLPHFTFSFRYLSSSLPAYL